MPLTRTTDRADQDLKGVAMDDQPLLSVRNLRTHFLSDEGVTRAVDGVSFDVYPGRTLGIVGETGCGKSITARSILRIVDEPGKIVDGEIRLRRDEGWLDLAALPAKSPRLRAVRGGEIGLVFQEPMASFSPVHTVGNQLTEAVRLHTELSKPQQRQRAVELLDMVGVPEPERRLGVYPWQLSGGLLQRAMIAMALAGGPKLLILDEPTTALDVITQAHILDLVRDLQDRTGLAIMLITHDLGVVAQMADEVVVMYLGRVAEHGPATQIFESPRHPYTRALLASIPSVASGQPGGRERLRTIAGSIPHPFNRPPGCLFHPRCAHAMANVCDREEPVPRLIAPDRGVSCHLDDGSLAGDNGRPAAAPTRLAVAEPRPNGGGGWVNGTAPLLQVRNLHKEYAVQGRRFGRARGTLRAVDDVTFEVTAGQTLALVGESGSGKTTVSRCVLRAVAPDSGEVLFRTATGDVVDLTRLPDKQLRPLRRELQMIFQDPFSSLNPRMSILEIVGEPLLLNGVRSRQERVDRVGELLRLVGLRPEYQRRYPHAFSGGQRQRIGIARALALNPRLVVADEPVSALDVSVQAQILNLMAELQERLGLTYLFVSHDLSVVRHISDRVGVMFGGRLVELGRTEEVLDDPKHPYTAALLAAVPRPDPATRARFNIPRGRPLNGSDPANGCQFERRCPFAVDRCRVEPPAWERIDGGRRVRCHRAAELTLGAGS
jgi:oligopeptide/dipeptide ABC transporter ATP-binding protein